MSFDLLTPEMRGVLAGVARARRPALHSLTPQAARAAYAAGAEILDLPRVALPRVEDLRIPMAAGHACPARLFSPVQAPTQTPSPDLLPVLLYLHGGGFTIGSPATHEALCRQIAQRSGVAVVSLDYRLAPEHRFPAAVDDSFEALQWLVQQAASLGLDGQRVAIGGDSAGATLAAVTALQARDAGIALALQLLITPGTAARTDSASHQRFAQGFLIERPLIDWFFDHYIDVEQRGDWRFAPIEAPDLDGVAPAWIGLAACDPLVDEGVAYADRLRLSNVPVDLELWKGVTHDFIKLGRTVPEALQAHEVIAAALRLALGLVTP